MGDKATFAVQVDKDSELYEDFEAYKSRGGFTSTSETLRHLMREEFEENEEQEAAGPWSALSSVAGEEAQQQVTLLGRYLFYAGVAMLLVELGVLFAPLWIAMAAVFGFLAIATTAAIVVGVGQSLIPSSSEHAAPTNH